MSRTSWLHQLGRSDFLVFALTVACLLVMAPLAPGFTSRGNLANLATGCLPLLVLAAGQTVVLITGGIDLSVGAIVGTTSVLGALVMGGDVGWLGGNAAATPVGLGMMFGAGALLGFLNGACVAWLRMPAFMVTLTTLMFFGGFAIWMARLGTGAETIYNLPTSFVALGRRALPSIVLGAMAVFLVDTLLRRTLAGRWLYAVGHNARAAEISGVPVAGTIVGAYVVSGLCAALAAVLLTGRLETASPNHGREMLLDVIGAVAIGGTSLFGGRGNILWTVQGVLFFAVLGNGLTSTNLDDSTITIAKGAVILVAAAMDVWRTRLAGRT